MNGFTPAPPCIPCLDRWPPGTLTKAKKDAYHAQQKAGNIAGLTFTQDNGITTVTYLSCIPQDWMRRQLADGLHTEPEQITIGDLE